MYGEEIPRTDEPYNTYPITFDVINGDTVNRRNKYRDKIGRWTHPDECSNCDRFNIVYDNSGNEHQFDYYYDSLGYSIHKNPTLGRFSIYKGDTINFVDLSGLKQGLHLDINYYRLKQGRPINKMEYYLDNKIVYAIEHHFTAHNTLIEEVLHVNGQCKHIKRYEHGRVSKTCKCEHRTTQFNEEYLESYDCIE